MNSAKEIIGRILAEHDTILRKSQIILHTSDDASIAAGLTQTESSIAGTASNITQTLHSLQSSIESLAKSLNAHFSFEETGLIFALDKYHNRQLSEAFSGLFLEHESLRNALSDADKAAGLLAAGNATGEDLSLKTQSLRQHLIRAVRLLQEHADREQKLLEDLRDRSD